MGFLLGSIPLLAVSFAEDDRLSLVFDEETFESVCEKCKD